MLAVVQHFPYRDTNLGLSCDDSPRIRVGIELREVGARYLETDAMTGIEATSNVAEIDQVPCGATRLNGARSAG